MDDGYVIGLPAILFPAFNRFEKKLNDRCGLEIQRMKTVVYTPQGVLPEETPEGLKLAVEEINGTFEPGFLCYGVPVGADKYVKHVLQEKVEEIASCARKAADLLGSDKQSLWILLKQSLCQQFDYWLQNCYPSQVISVASILDNVLWEIMETAIGNHVPKIDEGLDWDCPVAVPVETLRNRSFQHWVMRQPIKLGGMGLRSMLEVSSAAFVGAVEVAIPSMVGEDGVCPQLSREVGEAECFSVGGDIQTRWYYMLQSGCQVGTEFRRAWEILQEEAQQLSQWLETELVEPLSVDTMAAGLGSTSGSTRKAIIEQMEKLRGEALNKALLEHNDRQVRPTWAWPQRDKLTAHWLLALPGPETGLSSAVFVEAAAAHLCLPSPACSDKVGQKVGRTTVDIYGDKVRSVALPGDGFRTRHDTIKQLISRMCIWAGLNSECEVFGRFSGLIQQEGLNRMERGRKRQGLVPDFLIELPLEGRRGSEQVLAELKVISCCPTRYKSSNTSRAVDKRAGELHLEYVRKAKNIDRQFNLTEEGQKGPVLRKLETFGQVHGLVFGAFGEASEEVHKLLEILADSRFRKIGLLKGQIGSEGELSIIKAQIRRLFSVTIVRAQAQCLLDRLGWIGQGADGASSRRHQTIMTDRRLRREQQIHFVSQIQGKSIIRRGFFKLNRTRF